MNIGLNNRLNHKAQSSSGYVLFEIVIALGLFAAVSVSLVKAISMTSETASTIQDEMIIEQILHSALTEAISAPTLEEGVVSRDLTEITEDEDSYFTGQIETIIEPLELENEDGQLLPDMFKVKVVFHYQVKNAFCSIVSL